MRTIPLTQRKVALISDRDYPRVRPHKWQAHNNHGCWYAVTHLSAPGPGRKQRALRMHRLIRGDISGHIDHRNGNGLDNRRRNLRPATPSQNAANGKARGAISGFKGVCPDRKRKRWQARINVAGKTLCLGTFDTPVEAHAAYMRAARRYFGTFARSV